MLCTYHALEHLQDVKRLHWVEPILDAHGRALVDGKFVADGVVVEPPLKIGRTIEAGEPFEVDEKTEPHLAQAVISDNRFSVVGRRGGRNLTRAGNGI
jgi:hypothetical protein